MTTIPSPLKKIKSFFSFGELPHEELQNSSQRISPLEQSSPIERIPSESEVLNAIHQTFKIMEREEVFTESPNGSSVLGKNPWIILTKSELDDLTNTLDILLTAKKTQLLEKSFQEK